MHTNNNKILPWFILILIAGLILGGLAGYYYTALTKVTTDIGQSAKSVSKKNPEAEPTKSTTEVTSAGEYEGWQTYTNEKYNYTFKYPDGWGLIDYAYDNINNKIQNKWEFVVVDKNPIAENSIPYASEMPSSNFVMSAVFEQGEILDQKVISSTIDINGISANQYIYTTASEMTGEYYTVIQFEKDGQNYSITILNSDASGTHPEEIDKILQSIIFK